MITGSEFLL